MAAYALRLLGTPRLEVDGTEIHISRRKAMALLAYLAITGRPHTRDALATLLWPEWDASGARGALRRHLSLVNQLLGGDGLDTNRETVQISPDLDPWLDVAEFRRCLARCGSHDHGPTRACATCLPHLEEAIALYRDHFMAGFTLEAGAAFDDWQVFCAESLKEEMAGALVGVATYVASLGDLKRAIAHTRRWLALDPVSEPAHRHLMVLYAKSNRRTAALRQYATCCHVLETELGAEPSKRTQEIYLQVLRDELPATPATAEAILERELRTVGPCPYRGLAPFREVDASLFFGRESYIEQLYAAVTDAPYITAVVGPSGSGKSSVVAAGLLPRLREAGGWLIATFRPGSQPFRALANALIPALEPELSETARLIERRYLAEALDSGEVALIDVIGRIRDKVDGRPSVLLVIDQFEELYTLCPDAQMRQSFIDTVLAAVQTTPPARYERVPLVLLFTLRADFMGQALMHRHLADALQMAAQMLGPMTREELRAAIVKPAESQGAAFESGLVERLLNDIVGEPGNLPLLEFALTLLWEQLDFGWLTHAAYEQIGRAEGALARYAQEEFEALTAEDQQLARRIFVQLVQPGEGTEDTRRVSTRTELGDEAWDLVHHLADRRLVVTGSSAGTGEETVEVVHEALIQHWDQLQAWMTEVRAFRTWQERLRVSIQTWLSTDYDEDVLLRGIPLAEAEEWLDVRERDLGQTECEFVQASIALRERRTAERTAQRQRELDSARQLAAAHDQAVREREEALRQAAIGLASEARNQLLGPHQDIAASLALEAVEAYPYTHQAEFALAQVAATQRLAGAFAHGARQRGPARLSPDGTRILISGDNGIFSVWNRRTSEKLLSVRAHTQRGGFHTTARWSPSGDRILTASGSDGPRIWNATDGALLMELTGHGGVYANWSPDGMRVVSYYSYVEDAATVWDARTGVPVHTLQGDRGIVKIARYSPDGRYITTSIGDIWDARTGERRHRLPQYQHSITADLQLPMLWSPDSKLVGAGIDDSACVWDAASGEVTLTLNTAYQGRSCLYWSPKGDLVLTLADRQPAKIWLAATGEQVAQLPHSCRLNATVGAQMWSPTGTQLALPGTSGRISVHHIVPGREVLRISVSNGGDASSRWLPNSDGIISGNDGWTGIWRVSPATLSVGCWPKCPSASRGGFCRPPAWSPEGDRIGRSYFDGSIRIWEAATGGEILLLRQSCEGLHRCAVYALEWSPDGTRLAAGNASGDIELFDGATGKALCAWAVSDEIVLEALWSPGGHRLLTVSVDGSAVVWDAATGEAITVYSEHNPYSAAWSPDGILAVTVDAYTGTGPARIWNTHSGETLQTLLPDDFAYSTSAVAWSPDGAQIITFSADQVARVWAAETGELLGTFAGVPEARGAAYSPSGDRILVGSSSGIKVWDAATFLAVASYPASEDACASWSSDGTAIAISYYNGDLKVFPAWQSLGELVAYAKEHCVLRDLTPEERTQFGLPER